MNAYLLSLQAIVGLALLAIYNGCSTQPTRDKPRAAWSTVAGVPDSVLLDTAGVEWISSDARLWLRTAGPVAAVETHYDVSCERREVRDLGTRVVGPEGEIVGDSSVQAPAWIPAARHPALQPLLPALCARLSQLHPRGLDKLLGSDRP